MPICYKCGGEITFRYDDGVVKPIHLSGSCWDELDSSEISSSFPSKIATISTDPDDYCRPTICKTCGAEIFFIRHNGGSLWVNSPLGWPWPKHPCYYEEMTTQEHTHIVALAQAVTSPILGVVVYAQTRPNHMSDVVMVKCLDGREISCLVSYVKNPGNLIGKLAFLSLQEQKLVIPDAITYDILDVSITVPKTVQHQVPKTVQHQVMQEAQPKDKIHKTKTVQHQVMREAQPKDKIHKTIDNTKVSSDKFACEFCSMSFNKRKLLRSHRFKIHFKPKTKP